MSRSRRDFVPMSASLCGHDAPLAANDNALPGIQGEPGFHGIPVASSLLRAAVAATIAIGMLSLCASTALTLLAAHASIAQSLPT